LVFPGKRNFRNTIVLDIRPFRSRSIQKKENKEVRTRKIAAVYAALEALLEILNPKVIVVCHYDNSAVEEGLLSYLCLFVKRARETEFL
jgi:hypothetical protein